MTKCSLKTCIFDGALMKKVHCTVIIKQKKNKVFSHGNSVFWELTYFIVMKVSRNENIKRNVYEN